MSLLMINIPGDKRDYIINKFISKRIPVFSADRPNDIQLVLMKSDITHIFIGLSSSTVNWFDFLKELRQSEDGQEYKIIVSSDRQDKDYVKELLMLGIVGFIPANLDEEKAYIKLEKVFTASENVNKNRKHFRVSVPEDNVISVNFRLPNSDKFVTGRLTDLSIVALAFRLDIPTDSANLETGRSLDKVQLKVNNKLALVNLKILKTGPVTVGHITDASENTMNILSQFIYHEMIKKFNPGPQMAKVKA